MGSIRTISNPSIWKLGLALIPVPIVCVVAVIMRALPTWLWVIGAVSVAVYMILVTYYCVKQKCYRQLGQNYLILIVWIIIALLQFA